MTVRTAPAPSRSEVPAASPLPPLPAAVTDSALDEALDHIGELAERLWAVRRLHPVVARRSLLGRLRVRCAGCGHAAPCPTLRAASPS